MRYWPFRAGEANRPRTGDPGCGRPVLFQLSYCPMCAGASIPGTAGLSRLSAKDFRRFPRRSCPPLAEGAGLEPASGYPRRFSGPLRYHYANLPYRPAGFPARSIPPGGMSRFLQAAAYIIRGASVPTIRWWRAEPDSNRQSPAVPAGVFTQNTSCPCRRHRGGRRSQATGIMYFCAADSRPSRR